MKSTDVLMNEHRLIERVLEAAEAAADHLERGVAVRPGFFLDAAAFIAGFADGCHHHKEEGVLFPAMLRGGLPGESGPIPVMLHEHQQGRELTRAIREAATRMQEGDGGAAGRLVGSVRAYTALLRNHIAKEDGVLFPMADTMLSPQAEREVMEGFDRVEREETGTGAHERFHRLAEALEREAAALGSHAPA